MDTNRMDGTIPMIPTEIRSCFVPPWVSLEQVATIGRRHMHKRNLNGRETELTQVLLAIFRDEGNDWVLYHLNRSTQGMEQRDADILHEAFKKWKEQNGKVNKSL